MAETTGIAWTTSTWNPWIGCTEVSTEKTGGGGCDNCYARELDRRHRFGLKKGEGPAAGVAPHWGPGAARYRTKAWQTPLAWNGQAERSGVHWTVFPSLCDPFDNEVPDSWHSDLWALIAETPNLTWLLLTKRIGNARKLMPWVEHPFPNVWLGASVVNQEEADRDIPKLLATPAAKRFVSYEPALGPVDFAPWLGDSPVVAGIEDDIGGRGLDWLIIGGESSQGGAKARPFDLAWARSTVAQCKAAGVPVFVKQLGSNPIGIPATAYLCDRAGADPAEWPADLQIQEFPNG